MLNNHNVPRKIFIGFSKFDGRCMTTLAELIRELFGCIPVWEDNRKVDVTRPI